MTSNCPGGYLSRLLGATQVTTVQGWPSYLNGALLLSPTVAPENNPVSFLLVDNDKLSLTLARVSSRTPGIQFDLGALQRASPDFRPFSAQLNGSSSVPS